MFVLRFALVLGMVLHKLVWEMLKRKDTSSRRPYGKKPRAQQPSRPRRKVTLLKLVVKMGKVGYLVFLIVQALFLDLFPILEKPALLRTIGVVLYVVGLATAVIGRLHLGNSWVDLEDYQVLPEQSLVTRGIYRYIRHPIYVGDIQLLVGLELALNSWLVLTVLIPAAVAIRQAVAEEALLSRMLTGYDDYCKRTKRFIPFIV